ncbi:hypothetical protein [Cellulosimicrobium cellulans]|uniref:hypothetical protein n=1 Tax=Cellulosimicrobium cellulans TaxID=1710 RepID=UPI0012FD0911|nr:hypothetical protein [Cellulosimicrobium cellulans]
MTTTSRRSRCRRAGRDLGPALGEPGLARDGVDPLEAHDDDVAEPIDGERGLRARDRAARADRQREGRRADLGGLLEQVPRVDPVVVEPRVDRVRELGHVHPGVRACAPRVDGDDVVVEQVEREEGVVDEQVRDATERGCQDRVDRGDDPHPGEQWRVRRAEDLASLHRELVAVGRERDVVLGASHDPLVEEQVRDQVHVLGPVVIPVPTNRCSRVPARGSRASRTAWSSGTLMPAVSCTYGFRPSS